MVLLVAALSVAALSVAALSTPARAIDYDHLVELPIHRGHASRPTGRITGGSEVPPHSLPYQVGLFITVKNGTSFCGGSLITPSWVLTAAHCAEGGSSFEVVLGAHEIRNEAEATQVRVATTRKVVHPGWDAATLRNDIALLQLPRPVTLTDAIQTIRMPSMSQRGESFVGRKALESGWGKQSDAAAGIAERLQSVNKTVVSHEACNFKYFGSIDRESHICTDGSRGQSTCNGDSGGPLVVEEGDGRPTQIGVVSFGIVLGCQVGWSPAFTRTSFFLDFLGNHTDVLLRD